MRSFSKLRNNLQEIVASELSASDVKLEKDSVELIFEQAHGINRGKDLKILIDGNDFPERTQNIQERSERIAKKIAKMLPPAKGESRSGFVYIMLSAGGLEGFNF